MTLIQLWALAFSRRNLLYVILDQNNFTTRNSFQKQAVFPWRRCENSDARQNASDGHSPWRSVVAAKTTFYLEEW